MDVIALAQAGFGEAVAPLGTALTERQIEMLWRLVETPILCFDGDAAGQRAAMRAVVRALPLLRPAHSLRFRHAASGYRPRRFRPRDGRRARSKLCWPTPRRWSSLWAHELRCRAARHARGQRAGLKRRLMPTMPSIDRRSRHSHPISR